MTDFLKSLRKAAPYFLFLALGALALAGPVLFPHLVAFLYHAAPAAGPAASGSEIAAGQQGGGWVSSGTVGSKYIIAAGALILMVVLIWRLQNLTHPEPSRWAREDYTADFKLLSPVEKFEAYGRMRLQYVLLAAAALVFAALVV
ncbi:MAG: hypothetical protein ACRYFR_04945 [Janthinobacterium lividum]